jgi:hypothetical protein
MADDLEVTTEAPARASQAPAWPCQLAWVLLVLSILNWTGSGASASGPEQAGTVLATVLAFTLAVHVNPALAVGRMPFLVLAGLLAVASMIPGILDLVPVTTMLPSGRFVLVVATVALLSPRIMTDPVIFARAHLLATGGLTAAFVAEGVIWPGAAARPPGGRLGGVFPPTHPSQVGAIAAVAVGLTVICLVTRAVNRRPALAVLAVGAVALVQSRSRTPLLAGLAGLIVVLVSLAPRSPAARRVLVSMLAVAAAGWYAASDAILTWFARGQSKTQLEGVSGRRDVWRDMLDQPPDGSAFLFGHGLGDKRFDGRPIDSGWIAAYWEQGLAGAILAGLVLVTVLWALRRNRHPVAFPLALYLVVVVAVSSSTETGISDVSFSFLCLMLAGALAGIRSDPEPNKELPCGSSSSTAATGQPSRVVRTR